MGSGLSCCDSGQDDQRQILTNHEFRQPSPEPNSNEKIRIVQQAQRSNTQLPNYGSQAYGINHNRPNPNRNKQAEQRASQEKYENEQLKATIQQLTRDNEQLRSRLSAAISANLTDANPNIADLSDFNRPTKLAEIYSELYDNAWTELFTALTDNMHKTDQESIGWILQLFVKIFEECQQRANNDLEQLVQILGKFQTPQVQLLKKLKDDRKKVFKQQLEGIAPDIKSTLDITYKDEEAMRLSEQFINESIELCWLMAIQDPPVCIDVKTKQHGQPFDTTQYKHYTTTGSFVDYIVWPALYLHKEGGILSKGVAQGMHSDGQVEGDEAMGRDINDVNLEFTKM